MADNESAWGRVKDEFEQVGKWGGTQWRKLRGVPHEVGHAIETTGERISITVENFQDNSWRRGYRRSQWVRFGGAVALPFLSVANPLLGLAVGVALVVPEARRIMRRNVSQRRGLPESLGELVKLTGPAVASAYLGPVAMGVGYALGAVYDAARLHVETKQGTAPRLRR